MSNDCLKHISEKWKMIKLHTERQRRNTKHKQDNLYIKKDLFWNLNSIKLFMNLDWICARWQMREEKKFRAFVSCKKGFKWNLIKLFSQIKKTRQTPILILAPHDKQKSFFLEVFSRSLAIISLLMVLAFASTAGKLLQSFFSI